MPSHIPILPEDVLRLIFEEIANGIENNRQALLDHTRRSLRSITLRDLGSCALVSRAWRNVCYPVKWRSISLNMISVSTSSMHNFPFTSSQH